MTEHQEKCLHRRYSRFFVKGHRLFAIFGSKTMLASCIVRRYSAGTLTLEHQLISNKRSWPSRPSSRIQASQRPRVSMAWLLICSKVYDKLSAWRLPRCAYLKSYPSACPTLNSRAYRRYLAEQWISLAHPLIICCNTAKRLCEVNCIA